MSQPYQRNRPCSPDIIMTPHPTDDRERSVSLNDLTDLLNEVEISDEAAWQKILDRIVKGASITMPAAEVLVRSRDSVDPYHRVRHQR